MKFLSVLDLLGAIYFRSCYPSLNAVFHPPIPPSFLFIFVIIIIFIPSFCLPMSLTHVTLPILAPTVPILVLPHVILSMRRPASRFKPRFGLGRY